MIEKKINTTFIIADFDESLNAKKILINNAKKSLESAYSPYSGFSVGASILLNNGKTVEGSNQENIAYPIRFVC